MAPLRGFLYIYGAGWEKNRFDASKGFGLTIIPIWLRYAN
jgi:hypothetical protein